MRLFHRSLCQVMVLLLSQVVRQQGYEETFSGLQMLSSHLSVLQILLSDAALILYLSLLRRSTWQVIWEHLSLHNLTLDRQSCSPLFAPFMQPRAPGIFSGILQQCAYVEIKSHKTQNLAFLYTFYSLSLTQSTLKYIIAIILGKVVR